MAPKTRASAPKYDQATSAKELFDMIGETVQEKVHDAAQKYYTDLHGDLSKADYKNDRNPTNTTPQDPCLLQYDYNSNVTIGAGREYPCKDRPEVRFSDTEGAQCHSKKIRGSNGGACAPYRRLHICDYNLENINDYEKINNNTLLADVCLAALHEGQSIASQHGKYHTHSSGSTTCTVLARSFADIGDIIRGRDLYLGDNRKDREQKQKLQENLKTIFGKIHEGLTSTNGRNGESAKNHYNDTSKNYYKLREDWWEANRETIWRALTCRAPHSAHYTKSGADGSIEKSPMKQCRNITGVPTNFDYVPQYLRWLHEWAEDFCRKKKKRLEDVKKYCRGVYEGKERYCDRNGFDCERTIYKKGYFVIDKGCNTCSVWCRLYESWIDNQKKEFEKQKKQCENEISGNSRQKRNPSNKNYEGYEKKFYDILKGISGGGLDKFLDLLNNEKECKHFSTDEGTIDFKSVKSSSTSGTGISADSNSNKTFYRSKYCEECPLCGVEKGNNGNEWQQKNNGQCTRGNLYTISPNADSTNIDVLSFGDKRDAIRKKIDTFCLIQNGKSGQTSSSGSDDCGGTNNSDKDPSLCEKWQCYEEKDIIYDGQDDYLVHVKGAGGLCILKNRNKTSENDPEEFQKTFNNFFYFWIGRFLNDSMYWRDKINNCIEKAKKGKCQNNCEKLCGCFQRWIGKKKTEWGQIKTHFDTQKDLPMNHVSILKFVLKLEELFENIKSGYGNVKELKGINKILEEEKQKSQAEVGADNENNTTIDKLLQHEGEEAGECLKTHKEKCEKKAKPEGPGARSADPSQTPRASPTDSDGNPASSDEEEEEEEEDEGEVAGEGGQEGKNQVDVSGEGSKEAEVPAATDTSVDVCKTVEQALTSGKLDAACNLKYGTPNRYWGWRCVAPSGTTSGGGESGEPTTSSSGTGDRSQRSKRHTASSDSTTTGSGNDGPTRRVARAPSGEKTTGGLCIPPRRRKLYVGELTKWAKTSGNTQGGGDKATQASQGEKSPQGTTPASTSSPSNPRDGDLVKAFVESAAVETFFLWHKYKMENTKDKTSQGGLPAGSLPLPTLSGGIDSPSGTLDSNDPNNIYSGKIPPPFLRQMFYTLGDYRDIFEGKSIEVGDTSEDTKMQEIQKKIQDHINSGSKPGNSSPPPGPKNPSQPGDKRQTLWDEIAPSIWKAMICALTYKENSSGGEGASEGTPKVVKIQNASKLLEKIKEKEDEYHYEKVELKDENSETQPITPGSSSPSGGDPINNPKLKNFVEIPPFFRWLHEWGSDFCDTRKRLLKDVRDNCRNSEQEGKRHCSGDGHDCKRDDIKHNNMFAGLYCPDCYEQCRKYKKWIDIKFAEFHNQKNKYGNELDKLKTNSSGGGDNKNFYTSIKDYKSVDKFLEALKHCKNDQNSENKGNQEDKKNKINFEDIPQTFSRSTYCKTCPFNGVTCNRGRTGTNHCTPDNGNEWKKVFDGMSGNSGKTTTINVHMIDRRGPFIKEYLNNSKPSEDLFNASRLFKSVRDQNWECKFENENKDVCYLKNFEEKIDLNEYTTFKVFLEYWLEDFLYGYYLLKKRKIIEKCTQKEVKTSDEETKKNCVCVQKWVEQKSTQWDQIKKHYNKKNYGDRYPIAYKVISYFEKISSNINEYIDNFDTLKNDKVYEDCYVPNNCITENNKREKDIVSILLSELKNKIDTSNTQTDETEENCDALPLNDPGNPDDEHELTPQDMLQQEQQHPGICKDFIPEWKNPEEKICGDNGKRVNCKKVGKGKNNLINVPMDPPKTGDSSRNDDGDRTNCGGIDIRKHGEWKNTKELKYPNPSENIYVSPRRQKFCVHELDKAEDEPDLKNKLLTVAANQGYNLAIKYDEYKDKYTVNPCNALIYSYYDYEHIILGDDHLSHNNSNTEERLSKIFGNGNADGGKPGSSKRQNWWNKNKECVWSAMKCGYEKGKQYGGNNIPHITNCGGTPNEFDGVPQFFMWFTEWSEDFCNQRKEQLDTLKGACRGCTLGIDGKTCNDTQKCNACKTQCKEYQKWLKTWKEHYNKQKEKFLTHKSIYEDDTDVETSKNAYEYLGTQLENITCTNAYCDCMKDTSSENRNMPASLDYPPVEIEGKCTCVPDECNALSVTDSGFTDGSAFGGGVRGDK
ncbi:hypothetical protein PFTANZ_06368, partial [Plasmodium falciparum Tanzania (2000708)]